MDVGWAQARLGVCGAVVADPYYGAVPGLQGVWASGKSLEQCRNNLADVVEGWVLNRLARGLAIPPLGEVTVVAPQELIIA